MEKEKEVIKWLKKNNQSDNSFDEKEYKKGFSLFCMNSKNRALIFTLSAKKILPKHKAILHWNLTKILSRHIENNNLVALDFAKTNVSTTTAAVSNNQKKKVVEKELEVPKLTTLSDELKPDNLIKLEAKSGQLFAKSAVMHRELADKYFLRNSPLSDDEKKENEAIVIEIIANTNENISIHQESEHYKKTGTILGNHPDLIVVDYSVLSDDELFKKIKSAMSNIATYSSSLKTAKADKKMQIALKIQELQKKKTTLIAERDSRKK